jgi:GTP cyclohydrolase I
VTHTLVGPISGDATSDAESGDPAEEAFARFMTSLGLDTSDDVLAGTPRRDVGAFREFLTPRPFELTTFPNDGDNDEMVIVRSIPFNSLCEHHLLPFCGFAHVAYVPGERILGLSKMARVVEFHARRLQVQERLTVQIASLLWDTLKPQGVGVVLNAEHTCMTLRGVKAPGTTTVTSTMRGSFRDDPKTRREFLSLVHGNDR